MIAIFGNNWTAQLAESLFLIYATQLVDDNMNTGFQCEGTMSSWKEPGNLL